MQRAGEFERPRFSSKRTCRSDGHGPVPRRELIRRPPFAVPFAISSGTFLRSHENDGERGREEKNENRAEMNAKEKREGRRIMGEIQSAEGKRSFSVRISDYREIFFQDVADGIYGATRLVPKFESLRYSPLTILSKNVRLQRYRFLIH